MYELVNKHNHLLTLGGQRVARATESVGVGQLTAATAATGGRGGRRGGLGDAARAQA